MNKIANDPGYNMKTYIQAHSPRKECILIYIQYFYQLVMKISS